MRRLILLCPLASLLACSEYGLTGKEGEVGDTGACTLDLPTAGLHEIDEACTVAREPGVFEPAVEWRWDAAVLAPGFEDPMMMPAVGDVDGDGVPEVVLVAYQDRSYTGTGALTILDGATGEEQGAWTDLGGHSPYGSAGVALGDLDADGTPEIATISTDSRVLAVHADGSLVWASEPLPDDLRGYTAPQIADLDGDGLAEVVAGRAVFDHTGATVGVGDRKSVV